MFTSIKTAIYFLLLIVPFHTVQSQKTVYVQGTSNFEEVDYINLISQPIFWWSNSYRPESTSFKESASGCFYLNTTISTPGEFRFIMKNSNEQKAFAIPGDSVQFTIDSIRNGKRTEYYMKFTGKNAAQWNYGHLFSVAFPNRERPVYRKGEDIEAYKHEVSNWRDKQLKFLHSYKQEHALTDNFLTYAKARIDNDYTFQLYLPMRYNLITKETIPVDYLNEVANINFNVDNLLDCYRESLLLRYIHCYTDDTWNRFDLLYRNIVDTFTGQTRAYLLSSLIGIFAEHQDRSYSAQLLGAIKESGKYVQDPLYTDYIKKSEMLYLKLKKEIPEEVSANTVLTPYGSSSTITFKELLDSLKGKVLYIDFWASWCSPCKMDIANSAESKKYLEEQGIVYLYFSVDKDAEKWQTTAISEKVTDNQYLIKDNMTSALVKYLNVNSFPRYVMLDSAHELINMDAPRPTPNFFQKLKDAISFMNVKVIRFE